jgi:signal transduction histidine kinase/DNA-binding response OmpR family regulator
MSRLKAFLKGLKAAAPALQVIFVALAFTVMVIASYLFVSAFERRHLVTDALDAISYMRAQMEADMRETETVVNGLTQTIRSMALAGYSDEQMSAYLTIIADSMLTDSAKGLLGLYAGLGARHFAKIGGQDLSGEFDAAGRPWHTAAINANGDVVMTGPDTVMIHGVPERVVMFSRSVYDNDGGHLGVMAIGLSFEKLTGHLKKVETSKTGYAAIHDKNGVTLAHPFKAMLGLKLSEIDGNGNLAELEEELVTTGEIDEREVRNHNGSNVVVFFRPMANGWRIGLITPTGEYYKNTRLMALYLTALGALMASILCLILLRVTKSKKTSEQYARIMFDAMPLACHMWDSDGKSVMCNDEAVRLYGASSKEEVSSDFFKFSPELQPCGGNSRDMGRENVAKALAEGRLRFEWTHRTANGEPIPSEVTLIRAAYEGGTVVLAYVRDMREEKAALEIIREADERALMMLDAAPVGITLWDRNYNLIDFNMEAARVVGIYSKKEYFERFGETAPEYQPDGKKSVEKLAEFINLAFDEGHCQTEWVHNHINGEPIPFDATAVRLKYKGGDVVMVCCRDVREINAAIAKMREADERVRALLDATPLCANFWNKDFNNIDCNQEAARLFGMASKQEYLDRFQDLSPERQPDGRLSREKSIEFVKKAFDEGYCRFEWTHKKLDGELIPCEVTLVRVHFKGEYIVAGYTYDMRELNAAVAKMREADERAQTLLDSAPISCTLFDEDQNAIDCNSEAVKLVGAPSKEDYLANFAKYNAPIQPDGAPAAKKSVFMTKQALAKGYYRVEWTHQNAEGEPVPCEITLVRVKYKGKDVLAGYARDLRELKEMVRNTQRAEIAEKSNRAKSKFLAAMSHEIRTPMNVILGVAEMQMQDESLAPHQREALMQIYNSSDLLLGIINDILDLSKIEADKMEFAPTKYELASLVSDTASLNMMRSSKPTEFELAIDENAPARLFGDELRIKQILNNILSNAFKFTEEGTISLTVNVEEEPAENSGDSEHDVTLCMTVSDSGQGMTKEQIDILFSGSGEYTRFNLDTNRAIEGTGLGMSITQRLINMMGGRIAVESELGKGTTVCVRLPQKRIGAERIGRELADNLRKFRVGSSSNLKRSQFKRDYMPYGKVLIVDDVESNLYVAKGLMAPYGLNIETCTGGFDAIGKIKTGNIYDVIFMDHMMPKIDGIETTKRLRDLGYDSPIVALTANAVVGQADIFLKNGFDDFISKPIDVRQLNAVLNRLVRDKQTSETLEKAHKERDTELMELEAAKNVIPPELLAVFVRDSNKAMPVLKSAAANVAALSNEELQNFATTVHGLKSALANIGETTLSQMAQSLEKASKAKDRDAIKTQINNFVKSMREITAKAESESKTKEAAAEDEDPKLLREQMLIIANACRNYDERTVTEALELLKKMSWTDGTEQVIEKISEHLLHSSFEDAARLADEQNK